MTAVDFEKFVERLADVSAEAIMPFFRTALAADDKAHGGAFDPVTEADRAWLSLRDGHPRPAWQALERRRELIRRGKLNATANLLLCAVLGRNDEAFEAIEAGISTRAIEVLTLNVDPRLDSLRADRRYPAILRRIGIAPPAGLPVSGL